MLNSHSFKIIENFLNYILNEKRMSFNTYTSYKKDINDFCIYIGTIYEINSLNDVTNEIVRGWIANLIDKDLAKSTINRKISSIKSLYKFVCNRGFILNNPIKGLKELKLDKRLPSFLTEKELYTIIRDKEYPNTFSSIREKITLILLAGTGIRRAELISLKVSSINFDSRDIKVRGKRDKERIIPINSYILEELQSYLSIRERYILENAIIKDEGWLIISNKGKQSYPELIYRIVINGLKDIYNKERKSPHILRHTFATLLLNEGVDINSVKELLGHSSLAATQIYTHNTIEKMKHIYNDTHPRA